MNFHEAAAEWVRRKFKDDKSTPNPIVGTVEFEIDWAAYTSGPNYCVFAISWQEERTRPGPRYALVGRTKIRTIYRRNINVTKELPSDTDITELICEITNIALGDKPTDIPSESSSDGV